MSETQIVDWHSRSKEILEQGEVVFRLSWTPDDSGAVAGDECIYRFEGLYFAFSSYGDLLGPYPTILDLLKKEEFPWVTSETKAITCPELQTWDLAAHLRTCPGAQVAEFTINNERHFLLPDGELYDLAMWIGERGEMVFGVDWDSGNPGAGAGTEGIYKFDGMYYAVLSTDDLLGPYPSLRDVLQAEPGFWGVSSTTESIGCCEMTTDEILPHLVGDPGEEDTMFTVNGEPCLLTATGEVRRLSDQIPENEEAGSGRDGGAPGARVIAGYTEAIRLYPHSGRAYFRRGSARADAGDLAGAIADYTEALRLFPARADFAKADAHLGRAHARAAEGDLRGAIEDYTEAIRLLPSGERAGAHFFHRAFTRSDAGDRAGAIADYTEAIRLLPGGILKAGSYYNRAYSQAEQGDRAGAIADYSEAIRLLPDGEDKGRAFHSRGFLRAEEGDRAGAIADYGEAIYLYDDGADKAEVYHGRAASRRTLQDFAGAVDDYTKAIGLYPTEADQASGYFGRALTRNAAGDRVGAIADYTEAIRLYAADADQAKAYYNRAVVLTAIGQLQEAIEDYVRAIALNPGCPEPYYNTACAYGLQHDAGRACAWLEKAIALEPRARVTARTDPDLNSIRDDPRFQALVASSAEPENDVL